MKYLICSTDVYRVPTVEEAEQLHDTLRNDPHFTLMSFGYKTKYIKEKGEIVEEYQLITAKKAFTDEKFPESSVEISYEV